MQTYSLTVIIQDSSPDDNHKLGETIATAHITATEKQIKSIDYAVLNGETLTSGIKEFGWTNVMKCLCFLESKYLKQVSKLINEMKIVKLVSSSLKKKNLFRMLGNYLEYRNLGNVTLFAIQNAIEFFLERKVSLGQDIFITQKEYRCFMDEETRKSLSICGQRSIKNESCLADLVKYRCQTFDGGALALERLSSPFFHREDIRAEMIIEKC